MSILSTSSSPLSTSSSPSVAGRNPSGVTGNVLEPLGGYAVPPSSLALDNEGDRLADVAAWLDSAAPLALDSIPSTPEAVALVDALAEMVASTDTKRRGPKLRAKLSTAVGAVVSALLTNWGRSPARPVYRSGKATGFSNGPVGHRQFIAVIEGLQSLGFVGSQRGYQIATDWGDAKSWSGKAARFWPTAALLEFATSHGVTADTVDRQFKAPPPTKAPSVRKLVVVTSLKRTIGYRTGQGMKQQLEESVLSSELERVRSSVLATNAFCAQHDVQGCLPPRLKRTFTVNASLGGRWIAVGREGVYQTMPAAERLTRITIDGEPVAEVDVHASHLSIIHGLLGLPLPSDDLYGFPTVPRAVVKGWITATLEKGSPVTKWARKATGDNSELHDYDPRQVGGVICERYPFLRNPADAVAIPAGLNKMTRIERPSKLLTHRLMAIEAKALTGAMEYLRIARGVLALPMHDGLLVPLSGADHAPGVLVGAYSAAAKVRIRCTTQRALGEVRSAVDSGRRHVGVSQPP
jgi:hypothetical protein